MASGAGDSREILLLFPSKKDQHSTRASKDMLPRRSEDKVPERQEECSKLRAEKEGNTTQVHNGETLHWKERTCSSKGKVVRMCKSY